MIRLDLRKIPPAAEERLVERGPKEKAGRPAGRLFHSWGERQ